MNYKYKNNSFLIYTLGFLLTALAMGCECIKVECEVAPFSYIELTFMQDGEDIIFGDSPILDNEEVKISTNTDINVNYSTFENQIGLNISDGEVYTITLGELAAIEVQGDLVVISRDCCDVYGVENFKVDEVIICSSSCSDIIIELD